MNFSAPTIRKANAADIGAITHLLNLCADAMSQQGMHHWLDVYDENEVQTNMETKEVYVLEQDRQLLGCIALGTEKAAYYEDCWPDAPDADFYITQLAVDPLYHGRGYGQMLMQYCLKKTDDAVVQLDAVNHYPALLEFYKNLGFKIIASGIGLGDKRHLFSLQLS